MKTTSIFATVGIGALVAYVLGSPRFAEPLYRAALFEPHRFPRGNWDAPIWKVLEYQNCEFAGPDGVKLHGWYFGKTLNESKNGDLPTILVNHGNTGNISDLHVLVPLLLSLEIPVNVFVYDYRGYGKSASTPSVAGLCQDTLSAYSYLTEERKIPASKIFVYGESLGVSLSCYLSERKPVAGLILQSGFSQLRRIGYETFPLLGLFPPQLFPRPYFDNARALRNIKAPLLILHGKLDEEVRIHHAEALFASARGPKHLEILPNTPHSDIGQDDFSLFKELLSQFILNTVFQNETAVTSASYQSTLSAP